MKKQEMVDQIQEWYSLILPLVRRAGVPENRFSLDPAFGVVHLKYIQHAYIWLGQIRQLEWSEAAQIWNLIPPTQWAAYDARGETQMREIKLLNEKLKTLKLAVLDNDRPEIFRHQVCAALIKKRLSNVEKGLEK